MQTADGDGHFPACPYRAWPAADPSSTSGLPGALKPGLDPAPDGRLRRLRREAALDRGIEEGAFDNDAVDRAAGHELAERERRPVQRAVAAAGSGAADQVRFPRERRGAVAAASLRGAEPHRVVAGVGRCHLRKCNSTLTKSRQEHRGERRDSPATVPDPWRPFRSDSIKRMLVTLNDP
jgi:hypothetical protein